MGIEHKRQPSRGLIFVLRIWHWKDIGWGGNLRVFGHVWTRLPKKPTLPNARAVGTAANERDHMNTPKGS